MRTLLLLVLLCIAVVSSAADMDVRVLPFGLRPTVQKVNLTSGNNYTGYATFGYPTGLVMLFYEDASNHITMACNYYSYAKYGVEESTWLADSMTVPANTVFTFSPRSDTLWFADDDKNDAEVIYVMGFPHGEGGLR